MWSRGAVMGWREMMTFWNIMISQHVFRYTTMPIQAALLPSGTLLISLSSGMHLLDLKSGNMPKSSIGLKCPNTAAISAIQEESGDVHLEKPMQSKSASTI